MERLEQTLRLALNRAVEDETAGGGDAVVGAEAAFGSELRSGGNRESSGGGTRCGFADFTCIRAVDAQLNNAAQVQRASTDANIPLSLGLEAIAIGGGGSGGGAHTLQEWFDSNGRELGLKRILLTLLALAGAGDDGRLSGAEAHRPRNLFAALKRCATQRLNFAITSPDAVVESHPSTGSGQAVSQKMRDVGHPAFVVAFCCFTVLFLRAQNAVPGQTAVAPGPKADVIFVHANVYTGCPRTRNSVPSCAKRPCCARGSHSGVGRMWISKS